MSVNFVFVCMTAQGNIEFLSRLEFSSLNIKPFHVKICHTSSDRSCHHDYIDCFLCLTEAAERSSVQAQVSILIHTCTCLSAFLPLLLSHFVDAVI